MTMKLIESAMKRIPERKETGLPQLHRELIMCFQKSIRTEKRDRKEVTAFNKIADIATIDDIKILQRFYRIKKPKEFHEFLSLRVHAVDTLMNNYVKQLDIAVAYFKENPKAGLPSKPAVAQIPNEPEGWRKRAMGAFQSENHSSWFHFYKDYPTEAKRILNGEDLST